MLRRTETESRFATRSGCDFVTYGRQSQCLFDFFVEIGTSIGQNI